ncbi:hypothetical protein Tco_0146109 [Tanacetum coccineum]
MAVVGNRETVGNQGVLHAIDDNLGPTYDVKPLEKYLKKAQWEKPCLYNVQYDKNDLANMFAPESEETFQLEKKSRSKLDLKYVQSIENEVDDLKMEIDDLKSQLEHEKTDFLKGDDLLMQEFLSRDFCCVILLSLDDIDEYSEMACKYLEKIKECGHLEHELSKRHKQNHDKSFAQLEKHCINLELALQNAKEKSVLALKYVDLYGIIISVCENSWVKQSFTSWNNEKVLKAKNDSLIAELNHKTIEINVLKAQLQDKTIVNAEMRALLNKAKGKTVDTKFEKPSVVR